MFGLLNSASAISAAFFMDSAAMPALPPADSGRISATLTWPVPIAVDGCTAPPGCALNRSGRRAAGEQRQQTQRDAEARNARSRPFGLKPRDHAFLDDGAKSGRQARARRLAQRAGYSANG